MFKSHINDIYTSDCQVVRHDETVNDIYLRGVIRSCVRGIQQTAGGIGIVNGKGKVIGQVTVSDDTRGPVLLVGDRVFVNAL